MLAVTVLLVTGVLSTSQVLGVFNNEAPITVAAMFVLSAALDRTGVIERCGRFVVNFAGDSQFRALALVMVGAAGVSAFINNTPVVVSSPRW